MTKKLNVSLSDNLVVMEREDLEKLLAERKPVWITMKELEKETGYEQQWLKTNILNNPKYMKHLKENGIVYYPEGNHWAFNREPLREFLKDNFKDIHYKGGLI